MEAEREERERWITKEQQKIMDSINGKCLPFTRKNRKFRLENQMVRIIPFGTLCKLWQLVGVIHFLCSFQPLG